MLNSEHRIRYPALRRRAPRVLSALLAAAALAGCTPDRDPASLFAPGQIDVLVVDALLVNDRPLPPILLSRTIRPDRRYDDADTAVRGAAVAVVVAGADTVRYVEEPFLPGTYVPEAADAPVVLPETLYELAVDAGQGERLHAATVTPSPITIAEWVLLDAAGQNVVRNLRTFGEFADEEEIFAAPENQLVYQQGTLEGRLVAPRAAGTQVAISSLDLDADFVLDLPFLDDEDLAELRRTGSSPALALDTDTVSLPWFAVFWEGRHVLRVLLLDRNAYDLIRTSPVDAGFTAGGNAGDGFERPIFHVEGGIGLFGSAATDSIGFVVLAPGQGS